MDKKKSPRNTRRICGNAGSVFFANSGLNMTVTTQAHKAIAPKPGCSPDTLRARCVQAARDAGERDGLTSDRRARLKALERGNKQLRQANGIVRKASAYFAQAEPDDRRFGK